MSRSSLYYVDGELFKPIKGWVKTSALYDGDKSHKGYERCTLFEITSYINRAPTLKLLLEDGSLFSFMPLDSFFTKKPKEDTTYLDMKELAYKNCPDYEFVLSSPSYLQGKVNSYFKDRDIWIAGRYIASIDWHRDNLIMHIIKLENAQIAILPSHKVKFKDGKKEFKPYKKITKIWEV
ncbi:MAG: hypothetical protein ACOC08_05070 [Campylobacterales bacterium]